MMKKGEASGVPMWVVTLIIIMVLIIVSLIIINAANGGLTTGWGKVAGTVSGSGLTG